MRLRTAIVRTPILLGLRPRGGPVCARTGVIGAHEILPLTGALLGCVVRDVSVVERGRDPIAGMRDDLWPCMGQMLRNGS